MAKVFYHSTRKKNWKSIQKKGLIPQIGENSELIGDAEAVYLFTSVEALDTALGSWFGDLFDEDDKLYSLKVELPDDFEIVDEGVGYEVMSLKPIPSEYISFFKED